MYLQTVSRTSSGNKVYLKSSKRDINRRTSNECLTVKLLSQNRQILEVAAECVPESVNAEL